MKIDDIQRILIVGAGTMGQQIGLQCAMHGYQVSIYDIDPEMLDTATAQIEMYAGQLVATGRLTEAEAEAALTRITTTDDPDPDVYVDEQTAEQHLRTDRVGDVELDLDAAGEMSEAELERYLDDQLGEWEGK